MSSLIAVIRRVMPIIGLGAFLLFLSMALFSYNPRASAFGGTVSFFFIIWMVIYVAKIDVDQENLDEE